MTYVYNDLASEIKRKPTSEEIELVEKHHKRETNLYNDYNRILAEEKREIIALKCKECNQKNYTVYKSKNLKEKLEKKKYCKYCQKHTIHVETKVK